MTGIAELARDIQGFACELSALAECIRITASEADGFSLPSSTSTSLARVVNLSNVVDRHSELVSATAERLEDAFGAHFRHPYGGGSEFAKAFAAWLAACNAVDDPEIEEDTPEFERAVQAMSVQEKATKQQLATVRDYTELGRAIIFATNNGQAGVEEAVAAQLFEVAIRLDQGGAA